MNITEKILAKASGKNTLHPGEIVDANVDMVMVHDLTGPLAVEAFKKIGIEKVWNNEKVVDHYRVYVGIHDFSGLHGGFSGCFSQDFFCYVHGFASFQ